MSLHDAPFSAHSHPIRPLFFWGKRRRKLPPLLTKQWRRGLWPYPGGKELSYVYGLLLLASYFQTKPLEDPDEAVSATTLWMCYGCYGCYGYCVPWLLTLDFLLMYHLRCYGKSPLGPDNSLQRVRLDFQTPIREEAYERMDVCDVM